MSDLEEMRPCTNEAMRPFTLGPEGGRPSSPTQAFRHTCSGNFKILNCTTSAKIHSKIKTFGRKMGPQANGALCLSTPKQNGKSGTDKSYYLNVSFVLH